MIYLHMIVEAIMIIDAGLKDLGPFLVKIIEHKMPEKIPANWKALLR